MRVATPHNPTARRDGSPARGFTLTELLIVIGLIILVIALAVPAFKAMTGGRSIDAAQNQLAAVLGAARAEAIGLQKVRGVFFYLDPATERVNAVLVQESDYRPLLAEKPPVDPDYYIDAVPDRDPIPLPVGVGLQGIDNADFSGASRKDDGYVGYNPGPLGPNGNLCGGVILFDGFGRVINKFVGFHLGGLDVLSGGKQVRPTGLGEMFGYLPSDTPPKHFVPQQAVGGGGATTMNKMPPLSLFGFVLYDGEMFKAQGFGVNDPQFDPAAGAYAGKEREEEVWLDKNSVPVLINRYNGTLVRGE
jgi:type II secretory pathway pseudopilin PulG